MGVISIKPLVYILISTANAILFFLPSFKSVNYLKTFVPNQHKMTLENPRLCARKCPWIQKCISVPCAHGLEIFHVVDVTSDVSHSLYMESLQPSLIEYLVYCSFGKSSCVRLKSLISFIFQNDHFVIFFFFAFEPRREKTGLRVFRPGPTQTGLYKLRKEIEACNFGFK